jgi:hypothetical protein
MPSDLYTFRTGAVMGAAALILYCAFIAAEAVACALLAPVFGRERSFPRAFALAAYAFTPVFLVSLISIIPIESRVNEIFLGLMALFCCSYILYHGVQPMMGVSKKLVYFIICEAVYLGLMALALFGLYMPLAGWIYGLFS